MSYEDLLLRVDQWKADLATRGVESGECVAVIGDYCPESISLVLALADNGNIVVPLTDSVVAGNSDLLDVAKVSVEFQFDDSGRCDSRRRSFPDTHPLLEQLRAEGEPGLILFTSGSTGVSKAVLHSLNKLVDPSSNQSPPRITLAFLLWDHIGGQNTLFRILASGWTAVFPDGRDPTAVCQAIERHRVELIPTSPTFLTMLLLSGRHLHYDLSSLKVITYGTEPMPLGTLRDIRRALPHVSLKQTYGLSEMGILKSRSESSDSLWIKFGGEGVASKVVDGVLWLKTRSSMVGYLNAPSPFTEDGWYNTGDVVEVRGEYFRFRGRDSEVINVGGEKVYPAEVESVLLQLDGVTDATVRGAPSPVTGQVVEATLHLQSPEDSRALFRRVRMFCQGRLRPYQIPARVVIGDRLEYGERFKKIRGP
jgi:acyl-coenzyme A synthetase/AMP-(fatty) acid ligase